MFAVDDLYYIEEKPDFSSNCYNIFSNAFEKFTRRNCTVAERCGWFPRSKTKL